MREEFPGYYSPTPEAMASLWRDATFVLDTNVLLRLYRVPDATRRQMLDALKALKGRLWIPRQVGIEYQKNRLDAVHVEHQKAKAAVSDIERAFAAYQIAVSKADLNERGVDDADPILAEMAESANRVKAIVEKSLSGQLAPHEHDHIRDEIDELLKGRVGDPPNDQSVVDAWNEKGKQRFEMKLGPGHKDAEKADSSEPTFYAQGIVYQRQYGDLYLWFQLLEHAKQRGVKKVVFVTQDAKEDWWRLAPGGGKNRLRLAPQESLVEEIRRESGVGEFWMYSLESFLGDAKTYLDVAVSAVTLMEVQRNDEDFGESELLDDSDQRQIFWNRKSVIPHVREFARRHIGNSLLSSPTFRAGTGNGQWSKSLFVVTTKTQALERREFLASRVAELAKRANDSTDPIDSLELVLVGSAIPDDDEQINVRQLLANLFVPLFPFSKAINCTFVEAKKDSLDVSFGQRASLS